MRPTQFMQNLLQWSPSIGRVHALVMPLVDALVRVNLVDVRDVVEVEVNALTKAWHSGHTYTLAGPELITYAEVAERLSRGAGTPIPLRVASADRYRDEARAAGTSPAAVEKVVKYFSTLRTGATALAVNAGDVAAVTGHEPRSLEAFARDYASAFRESQPPTSTWIG